jgi:5-methyltetrahydrofolate--homocysteine methyltransferase
VGRLLDALARGPLVLDAAIGTRLIARGLDTQRDDPVLWNLDRPEAVGDCHHADADAGADILLTNTFGGNRAWLDRFGRAGEVLAANRRAVELARQAGGAARLILGNIGPTAVDCEATVREQADALADSGVDGLILETMRFEQAARGLGWLGAETGLTLLVSLIGGVGELDAQDGDTPSSRVRRLADLGAAAVGLNCGPVGAIVAELLWAAADPGVPLLAKPAGQVPGQRPEPPEAFADAVPALLAAGVRGIGGCCGTTEAHVAALRAAVDRTASAPGGLAG